MGRGGRRGVVYELDGDVAKLVDGLRNLEAKWKQHDAVAGDSVKRQDQGLRKQGETANWLSGQVGSLTSRFMQFASVGAVIAGVTKELRGLRDMADAAGESARTTADARTRLLSIAADQDQFDEMIGLSRQLERGGMERLEAKDLVFTVGSEAQHLLNERGMEFLLALLNAGLDPQQVVQVTKTAQTAFGGAGLGATGAGREQEMAGKLGVAAQQSRFTTGDFAGAVSAPMASVGQLGGHDEDVLAMLSVFGDSVESASEAATMINALATVLLRKRHLIEGGDQMGFLDIVTNIPELERRGALRDESGDAVSAVQFLGRQEAMRGAFLADTNRSRIFRLRQEISDAEFATGTDQGFVEQRLQMRRADPVLSAEQAVREQEGARRVQDDSLVTPNLVAQAMQEQIRVQRTEELGGGRFGRVMAGIEDRMLSLSRTLHGDEHFIRMMRGEGMISSGPQVDEGLLDLSAPMGADGTALPEWLRMFAFPIQRAAEEGRTAQVEAAEEQRAASAVHLEAASSMKEAADKLREAIDMWSITGMRGPRPTMSDVVAGRNAGVE